MSNEENKKSFWTSLPGILTGIGAVIAAIGSILAVQYGGNTLNPGTDHDSQTGSANAPLDSSSSVPRAKAGGPTTVNEGEIVTLYGTDSLDKDGEVVSYKWAQTDGPPVDLSNDKVAKPTFTAPENIAVDTLLTFNLRVTDNEGNTSPPDTVGITIRNVNQASVSDEKNIASDEGVKDIITANTPPSAAPINNSPTTTVPPSNANKQVTLKHEASFIPEELRNPGLKSFTHSIKVWIDARPQILDLIKNVTYYPQPSLTSFQKPVTLDSPSDNFAYSFNALEDFELKTRIYFKDGEVEHLSTITHFLR
jgi:hypothetical protein